MDFEQILLYNFKAEQIMNEVREYSKNSIISIKIIYSIYIRYNLYTVYCERIFGSKAVDSLSGAIT